MPTPEMIANFREGINILKQVDDFATLQKTINRMVGNIPPEELALPKDAIARVLQNKQATEVRTYQDFPSKLEQLEIKYRDLYVVLKTSKSLIVPKPAALPTSNNAPTGAPSMKNAMAKAPNPMGGFGMAAMLKDWLLDKKKYIMAGGAVGVVGGAYFLYKQLNKEPEKKKEEESSFDKTIKSIQKYRAFTQMMKNPDFSGDYRELVNGNAKPKRIKKKKDTKKPLKSSEWETDEKSLMKDMDAAFNSISTKPKLNYQLPQLPAPKNIDPNDVIGEDRPLELTFGGSSSKRDIPKQQKKRKKRSKKQETVESVPESTPEPISSPEPVVEAAPVEKKPKQKRVKKTKTTDEAPGRLIPIVKRTKRVKKVGA